MLLLLITVSVGAIIGVITNGIAIAMLFRPWKEIRMFGMRMPFTPGLLPRRQEELAQKIGQVVEKELLTAESVADALSKEWLLDLKAQVHQQLRTRFEGSVTVDQTIAGIVGYETWFEWRRQIPESIAEHLQLAFHRQDDRTFADMLPEDLRTGIHEWVVSRIPHILNLLATSLNQPDVQRFVADQLRQKISGSAGVMGTFAASLFPDARIAESVLNRLQEAIQDEKTIRFVQRKIDDHWEIWEQRSVREWGELLNQSWMEPQSIKDLLSNVREIIGTWNLWEWYQRNQEQAEKWIDHGLDLLYSKSIHMLPSIFETIQIGHIVEKKVASFSLPKLEKLIVEIVRKELNAITWLGGVLGGVIGLLQFVLTKMFS